MLPSALERLPFASLLFAWKFFILEWLHAFAFTNHHCPTYRFGSYKPRLSFSTGPSFPHTHNCHSFVSLFYCGLALAIPLCISVPVSVCTVYPCTIDPLCTWFKWECISLKFGGSCSAKRSLQSIFVAWIRGGATILFNKLQNVLRSAGLSCIGFSVLRFLPKLWLDSYMNVESSYEMARMLESASYMQPSAAHFSHIRESFNWKVDEQWAHRLPDAKTQTAGGC